MGQPRQFKHKPVLVEAFQTDVPIALSDDRGGRVAIARAGTWIVLGEDSQLFPIDEETFSKNYEAATVTEKEEERREEAVNYDTDVDPLSVEVEEQVGIYDYKHDPSKTTSVIAWRVWEHGLVQTVHGLQGVKPGEWITYSVGNGQYVLPNALFHGFYQYNPAATASLRRLNRGTPEQKGENDNGND